jgi:hypothetical protein
MSVEKCGRNAIYIPWSRKSQAADHPSLSMHVESKCDSSSLRDAHDEYDHTVEALVDVSLFMEP